MVKTANPGIVHFVRKLEIENNINIITKQALNHYLYEKKLCTSNIPGMELK